MRHRFVALLGIAALAIQFAFAFGHHHDYSAQPVDMVATHGLSKSSHAQPSRHHHDHHHDHAGHAHHRQPQADQVTLPPLGVSDHTPPHKDAPSEHHDEADCDICLLIRALNSAIVSEFSIAWAAGVTARVQHDYFNEHALGCRVRTAHQPRAPPCRQTT